MCNLSSSPCVLFNVEFINSHIEKLKKHTLSFSSKPQFFLYELVEILPHSLFKA